MYLSRYHEGPERVDIGCKLKKVLLEELLPDNGCGHPAQIYIPCRRAIKSAGGCVFYANCTRRLDLIVVHGCIYE